MRLLKLGGSILHIGRHYSGLKEGEKVSRLSCLSSKTQTVASEVDHGTASEEGVVPTVLVAASAPPPEDQGNYGWRVVRDE